MRLRGRLRAAERVVRLMAHEERAKSTEVAALEREVVEKERTAEVQRAEAEKLREEMLRREEEMARCLMRGARAGERDNLTFQVRGRLQFVWQHPCGIAVNERGCPVIVDLTILEGVKFLPGSAEFAPGAQEALDMWVAVLAENPELMFQIVGSTDSKGNRKQMISLLRKRDQAVFDYFSSKGISEARMTAVGKDPADPIASNKTEEGRAANNRIAILPLQER